MNFTHVLSLGTSSRSARPLARHVLAFGLTALVVLGLTAHPAHAQNLVTNPGFETGDLTGYVPTGYASVLKGGSPFVHSGSYAASFPLTPGSSTFPSLSQSIPTLAGQTYNISFFFTSSGGPVGVPSGFQASFGTIQGMDVLNTPYLSYQQFSFQAQASGPATTLRFTSFGNANIFYLDDLSVTAASPVPEASTTVSFGLLLAFGLGGLVVVARRKKSAP